MLNISLLPVASLGFLSSRSSLYIIYSFLVVLDPVLHASEITKSITNVNQSTTIKPTETTSRKFTATLNVTTTPTKNATQIPTINTTISIIKPTQTTKITNANVKAAAHQASLIVAVGFIPSLVFVYILCTYVPFWCNKRGKE